MKNKRHFKSALIAALAAIALILLILPAISGDMPQVSTTSEDQTNIAITIYNDGTGLVKDTRTLDLPNGYFDLKYMDVAASIDPTSVHFVSLTNPDALGILEQNYEYDLVSTQALYQANIDNHVAVKTSDNRTVEGKLLAYDGNLVIQTSSGIVIVSSPVEVSFDVLPEGLITRPTLKWSLVNNLAASQETEMSYLTSGLGWTANYVAVVNQNDDKLDLSGWVTINNNSGADYKNAVLKLVAGQVNKVQPTPPPMPSAGLGMAMAAPNVPGFQEEAFFEYHLYTLERPATVLNNEQKQISLMEASGIGVTKVFLFNPGYQYYGTGDTAQGEIETRLKFMNSEANGLGIPLPAGILRVYKKDSSGALQFIGEDRINHTPKDEEIEVFLGKAFDIVGERVVMDQRQINDRTWEYDVQVTIRNHKDQAIEVLFWDNVWGDWQVKRSSLPYRQKDASTVEFNIPVTSNGETVLTYTIRRG